MQCDEANIDHASKGSGLMYICPLLCLMIVDMNESRQSIGEIVSGVQFPVPVYV